MMTDRNGIPDRRTIEQRLYDYLTYKRVEHARRDANADPLMTYRCPTCEAKTVSLFLCPACCGTLADAIIPPGKGTTPRSPNDERPDQDPRSNGVSGVRDRGGFG